MWGWEKIWYSPENVDAHYTMGENSKDIGGGIWEYVRDTLPRSC